MRLRVRVRVRGWLRRVCAFARGCVRVAGRVRFLDLRAAHDVPVGAHAQAAAAARRHRPRRRSHGPRMDQGSTQMCAAHWVRDGTRARSLNGPAGRVGCAPVRGPACPRRSLKTGDADKQPSPVHGANAYTSGCRYPKCTAAPPAPPTPPPPPPGPNGQVCNTGTVCGAAYQVNGEGCCPYASVPYFPAAVVGSGWWPCASHATLCPVHCNPPSGGKGAGSRGRAARRAPISTPPPSQVPFTTSHRRRRLHRRGCGTAARRAAHMATH